MGASSDDRIYGQADLEAAVSVVRAEVERANQHADEWAATADRWTHRAAENGRRAGSAEADLRALLEGLEALADELDTFARDGEISSGIAMGWRSGVKIAAHNVRERLALLAPSPAEGTGEADDLNITFDRMPKSSEVVARFPLPHE